MKKYGGYTIDNNGVMHKIHTMMLAVNYRNCVWNLGVTK